MMSLHFSLILVGFGTINKKSFSLNSITFFIKAFKELGIMLKENIILFGIS